MKIIADQQIPLAKQAFSGFGEVHLSDGREITHQLIKDADILLVRSVTHVDKNLLDGSKIRFVATATSGIEHIDTNSLKNSEIGFAYAPGSNARSVAEYLLSSLFVIADQKGYSLLEKTVGIIGCGEIGSRVLSFLESINVQCVVNDPPLKDKTDDPLYRDLEEVLKSDIITLHVPLTHDDVYPTLHMVDAGFLSQMEHNCLLINTSRGEVIDKSALKNLLKKNTDLSVVLDVWDNEPRIDTELLAHSAIATPHIAGYSFDGKICATEMLYKQVCQFFNRQDEWKPLNVCSGAEFSELRVADEMDEYDAVQFSVLANYDVRSDSASLSRMLKINRDQQCQYFDELRKNYPIRREFPSIRIDIHANRSALIQKLTQLGFTIKSH